MYRLNGLYLEIYVYIYDILKYIYIYSHTHVYTYTYMHVKIINEKRGNNLKESRKEHISGFGVRKGEKEVNLYFNL